MHVQNIHTMDELKMTGNCLKGSRGIVSFDKAFDETEWGRLTREVFTHVSSIAYALVSPMREVLTFLIDIRRTSGCKESETFRRPHPYFLPPRQQNMVP